MTLGKYIKAYRDAHDKMSVRAFAALAGLSPQYVINIEKGLNNDGKPLSPTMETYTKIAKATGISETELMLKLDNEAKINPKLSDRERILVQKFRNANEERKQAVESVLDGVSLRKAKIVPLFPAAAGAGEPIEGNAFEDYETDNEKADFAVRISGDSMEPVFQDGEIVLCKREEIAVGDIAVVMVNGFLLVKQFIDGYDGQWYLRSLNRERSNLDYDYLPSGNDRIDLFGKVIHKRIPLVKQ